MEASLPQICKDERIVIGGEVRQGFAEGQLELLSLGSRSGKWRGRGEMQAVAICLGFVWSKGSIYRSDS